VDFVFYDQRKRREHEQLAETRYCTASLIEKADSLHKSINLDASEKFDRLIDRKTEKRNLAKNKLHEIDTMLAMFTRNYKEELAKLHREKDALIEEKNELYVEMEELKHEISHAFDQKDKAYYELNQAKDRVNSWYAKSDRSTWLFGNSGRKLPQHSLFHQSHGDLSSYKRERDSAYGDVVEAKSEIGSLKDKQGRTYSSITQVKERIGDVFDKINGVKKDRSKMHELKNAGHTRRDLQAERDKLYDKFCKIIDELKGLASSKNDFIELEKGLRGLTALERDIKKLEDGKVEFLKSFDCRENKKFRKLRHREEWLQKRGLD